MPRRADRDWTRVTFRDHELREPRGGPDWARRLDGGWTFDSDFAVTIDDPDLEHLIELVVTATEGRLVADSITVRRRDHTSHAVDGEVLRGLPIASYVQQAVASYVQQAAASLDPDLHLFPARITRTDVGGILFKALGPEEQLAAAQANQSSGRRGKAQTLAEVARLYREALAHPEAIVRDAPTQYVADRLPCSRGHASRLVTEARRAGQLGPARRNRAGEQPRTDPTPDRSTDDE